MSDALIIELGRNTLLTILMLSGPMLLLSLVVGLTVSIFQAATHISEMTLTFIPKLVAMGIALLFFLPWMLQMFRVYVQELMLQVPQLIR
jgi:flagellar biosynthesis protein FliQ